MLTVIAIEILLHTKKSYPIVCAKKGTLLAAEEYTGKRGILRLFFSIFCRFSFNLLIHNNQWELSFQKYVRLYYSRCRLENTFVWKVSKKGKIYLTGAEKQQPNPCKYHQSIQHPRQSKNKLAYRWVIADRDARMLCYSFLVINVLDLMKVTECSIECETLMETCLQIEWQTLQSSTFIIRGQA